LNAITQAEREQLGWDFFYHGRLALHEVIDELRPHLEPDDAEVTEHLYRDTIAKMPGSSEGLPADAFHQRLVASLIRLAAARSDVALKDIGRLLVTYPDKTELLCSYLMSLASVAPGEVEEQIRPVFANNRFWTEWEAAWAIRVLARVASVVSAPILEQIHKLVEAPHGRWLAAVEATKLLAARHEVDHPSLSRLWNTCPSVFRVDLVVAAESMAANFTWAKDFSAAAQSDPIHLVVARQLTNRASNSSP
jgi:hypothetical protein